MGGSDYIKGLDLLKAISGGDTIRWQQKYEHGGSFRPNMVAVIGTNVQTSAYSFSSMGVDNLGAWERRIVPFEFNPGRGTPVKDIEETLDLGEVGSWCVDQYLRLKSRKGGDLIPTDFQ